MDGIQQIAPTKTAGPSCSATAIAGRLILVALIALSLDWMGPVLLSLLCTGSLLRHFVGRPVTPRWTAIKAGLYAVGAAMAFALLSMHRADDQAAADRIIESAERYRQVHGVYPEALTQLTPEQLAEVPSPRNGRFFYRRADAGGFTLGYVDMPPGGERTYDSADRIWRNSPD